MAHQNQLEPDSVLQKPSNEPNVRLDMKGFLSELRDWIKAIEDGNWEVASERLRDACDEAYCLEGWNEFTSRLGEPSMQNHVQNLRKFLVAVETTARAHAEHHRAAESE